MIMVGEGGKRSTFARFLYTMFQVHNVPGTMCIKKEAWSEDGIIFANYGIIFANYGIIIANPYNIISNVLNTHPLFVHLQLK